MDISLTFLTGKKLYMKVKPTDLVLDIKRRVNDQEAIPWHLQRLLYDKNVLADNKLLSDYHIHTSSIIHIIVGNPKKLKIHMRSQIWSDEVILNANSTDSIWHLKVKLFNSAAHRIFPLAQEIVWNGIILKDNVLFGDFEEMDNSPVMCLKKCDSMQLPIQIWHGKTVYQPVKVNDTIGSVKRTLEANGLSGHLVCDHIELDENLILQQHISCYNDLPLQLCREQEFYVFIQTVKDKRLHIKVTSSDRILNVKQQIQKKEGIPVDKQLLILSYIGKCLANQRTCADYGLIEGTSLQVKFLQRQTTENTVECQHTERQTRNRKYAVSVDLLTSKVISVDVYSTTTIQQLKEMVEQKTGLPVDQQQMSLMLLGKMLRQDQLTLADYGIGQHCMITLRQKSKDPDPLQTAIQSSTASLQKSTSVKYQSSRLCHLNREDRCNYCGLTGHVTINCWHRTPLECWNCHQIGHKAKVCHLF